MNHYSELYNAEALLISGAYCLFFVLTFWRLLSKNNYSYHDKVLFIILYIAFTSFSYIASYIKILPFFPDTLKFAELVETGQHDSSSLGVRLYVFVSAPLRVLAFNQIEVYLVFQCSLYFASIILLWQGWRMHCKQHNLLAGNFQVMVLLSFCYPAALAFITIPLREFIQIFGFSLFLYGLSCYVYKKKMSWLIVGALLTIFVRPQLVIVYPLLLLIAKQYSILRLCIYGVFILPIAIILFEQVTNYHFNPGFFAFLRNSANAHYLSSGMTYGTVNWQTYWHILVDLPLLILQFLLSPLPILHNVNPLTMKFLLIDLFYVLFILFGAISVRFTYSKNYLNMFICLVAIFSIWEFFIGGAVRHRFPLIMMLLPLATMYYSIQLNHLVKKS